MDRWKLELENEFVDRGRREGRQEGIQQNSIMVARNMKNDGMAVDIIVKYTGLSKTEVEQI